MSVPIPPPSQLVPKWQTVLSPEGFLWVCTWVDCVCSLFTLTLFCLLVFVVLRHSPKAMGNYRFYLLLNGLHCVVIDSWVGLFQPESLAPHPILVLRGVCVWLSLSPPTVGLFGLLMCFAIFGTGFTTVYLFIYRFVQTTDHWLQPHFARFRTYFFLYALWSICAFCSVGIPFITFGTMQADVLVVWVEFDEELVRRVRSGVAAGLILNDHTRHLVYLGEVAIVVLVLFAFGVILFCATGVYRFMRTHAESLSPQTLQLYRSLMRALMIEVVLSHAAASFGFALIFLSMNFHLRLGPILSTVAVSIASTYGTLTHLCILLNIRSYREGVLGLLKRIPLVGRLFSKRPREVTAASSSAVVPLQLDGRNGGRASRAPSLISQLSAVRPPAMTRN